MTTADAEYPSDDPSVENEVIEHDLDPTNGDGDLVRHLSVGRLQAIVIAVNSVDGNNCSVSVRWIDTADDDNEFVSQAKTAVLDSVTNDWARLNRKGPTAEVTVTSEVAGGTQNRINAAIVGHR